MTNDKLCGQINTLDPATGDVLASVPNMRREDARMAIDAAGRAFEEWKGESARVRVGTSRNGVCR